MSIDILNSSFNRFSEAGPQFDNMWELYIDDWSDGNYGISKFDVISSSIPLSFQLKTDSYVHGKNYYTDVEYPSSFKIDMRETTDFKIYNYFKNWMDTIFDSERGVFLSNSTKKTKNATLSFTSFKMNKSKYKMLSAEYIENKMRNIQTIASQTLIQQAKSYASKSVPYPLSMITGQAASIASMEAQSILNRNAPSKFGDIFEEIETMTFFIKNLRIQGMSDVSLSYDTGEPMSISIDFVADRFIEKKKPSPNGNYSLEEGNMSKTTQTFA